MTGFGKGSKGTILYDRISHSEALSTLAADDVLTLSSFYDGGNLENDFRILRMEVFASLQGLTTGEGPILFGFAAGSLTAALIEETLEAITNGWDDDEAAEASHRPVWVLGQFAFPGGIAAGGLLNGGMPTEWTKRWTFSGESGWVWWVYNMGSGALTTGATLGLLAKIYGVWVK